MGSLWTPEEIKKLVGTADLTQGNAGDDLSAALPPPPDAPAAPSGPAPYDAVDMDGHAPARLSAPPMVASQPSPTQPPQPPPNAPPAPAQAPLAPVSGPGAPPPMPPPSFSSRLAAQQGGNSADELEQALSKDDEARKGQNITSALNNWAFRRPNTPDYGPSAVDRMKMMQGARASDVSMYNASALKDNASAESQRARALFSGTATGQAFKARLGPLFDQLSASQIPGVEALLKNDHDQAELSQKDAHEKEQVRQFGISSEEAKRNHDAEDVRSREASAASRAQSAAQMAAMLNNQKQSLETDLRKEVTGSQPVKDLKLIQTMADKAVAAAKNPSAAGDISMIYAYMKLLDPNSSVRESEYASAANAGGVPDKLRAKFNAIRDGERLAPAQRADFLNQIQGLVDANKKSAAEVTDRYRGIAEKKHIDPNMVADPIDMLSPEDKQALQWAKSNKTDPVAIQFLKLHGLE